MRSEDGAALRDLFYRHKLLLFRGQSLTREEQFGVLEHIGPVDRASPHALGAAAAHHVLARGLVARRAVLAERVGLGHLGGVGRAGPAGEAPEAGVRGGERASLAGQ